MKLNMLKPSVNNMAVRVFVRAANLPFTEDDVWGKTRTPEFLQKNPAHMTPMLEMEELPKGGLWESCAIMQYLCNKHEIAALYPETAERRAMVDSAMFYLIGARPIQPSGSPNMRVKWEQATPLRPRRRRRRRPR